jgi:hypothetical protein
MPWPQHDVYLTGNHSHMEKVRYDPLDLTIPPMARADPEFLDLPVEHSPSPAGLPTSLHLADGNGGEYRKSCEEPPLPESVRAAATTSPDASCCNMSLQTMDSRALLRMSSTRQSRSTATPCSSTRGVSHALSPRAEQIRRRRLYRRCCHATMYRSCMTSLNLGVSAGRHRPR